MRKNRMIVATALALTALSACGSSSSTDKNGGTQVASLATPEASAGATARPKQERPRERLDTTPEEYEAMRAPFEKCLKKAGFTDQLQWKKASDKAQNTAAPLSSKDAKQAAAYTVCEERYLPLPPWERDPANPEAADFARDVDKCLRRKGVDLDAKPGELSSSEINKAMGLDTECEHEVAAAMK